VSASAVRAGSDLVEVVWPSPEVQWQTRVAEDADALARGQRPYVLPVFGELFSARFSGAVIGEVPSWMTGAGRAQLVRAAGSSSREWMTRMPLLMAVLRLVCARSSQ
jgi:hypothetical protein